MRLSEQSLRAQSILAGAWDLDATAATELALALAAQDCLSALSRGVPITRPAMPVLALVAHGHAKIIQHFS